MKITITHTPAEDREAHLIASFIKRLSVGTEIICRKNGAQPPPHVRENTSLVLNPAE